MMLFDRVGLGAGGGARWWGGSPGVGFQTKDGVSDMGMGFQTRGGVPDMGMGLQTCGWGSR